MSIELKFKQPHELYSIFEQKAVYIDYTRTQTSDLFALQDLDASETPTEWHWQESYLFNILAKYL